MAGVVSHSRFLVAGLTPFGILVVSRHYLEEAVQDSVKHHVIWGPM